MIIKRQLSKKMLMEAIRRRQARPPLLVAAQLRGRSRTTRTSMWGMTSCNNQGAIEGRRKCSFATRARMAHWSSSTIIRRRRAGNIVTMRRTWRMKRRRRVMIVEIVRMSCGRGPVDTASKMPLRPKGPGIGELNKRYAAYAYGERIERPQMVV